MYLKTKATLAVLGAFHLLTWAPHAQAQSIQTQVVESTLNGIKDVVTSKGEDQKKFCTTLQSSISSLIPFAASAAKMQPLLQKAQGIQQSYCLSSSTSVVVPVVSSFNGDNSLEPAGAREDAPKPQNPVPTPAPGGGTPKPTPPEEPKVWKEQPHCGAGNSDTIFCQYRHESGRGMYIYKQPGVSSFPNYLICAMTAGQSSGPFASGYSITSRCLVSSADWREYATNVDANLQLRSDIQGMLTWMYQDSYMAPMALPGSIYSQCGEAFSESLFCSPQLIILPTQTSDLVDVCQLNSSRSAFGLGIIRITSGSSKWTCKRTDLRIQEPDGVLSVQENSCVPSSFGKVNPACDLPYIPRAQQPVRISQETRPISEPEGPAALPDTIHGEIEFAEF